jgi:AraC-like DNA-binding protein
MVYKQYPVHPALRTWLRYFWSYDVFTEEVQTFHIRSFADRYPRLIFQDIASSSLITEADGSTKPICYLSGIDTLPTHTYWDSRFSHFGVSFQPHALHAIFGISASELVNQTPDIELLEKERLTHILTAAQSHEERVAVLQAYFYKKIQRCRQDTIITGIFTSPGSMHRDEDLKLAALARDHRISERQLQRRFKQSVGISASKFQRLTKFEASLHRLSKVAYGDLTSLSYDLGYSDQSHFIHDFRKFSGITPYEFVRSKTLGSESASFIYAEN